MGAFILGLFVSGAAILGALANVGGNIPEFLMVAGGITVAYGAGRIGEKTTRDAETRPHDPR